MFVWLIDVCWLFVCQFCFCCLFGFVVVVVAVVVVVMVVMVVVCCCLFLVIDLFDFVVVFVCFACLLACWP